MAMSATVLCPHNITGAIVASSTSKTKTKTKNKRMIHVTGLNSFWGLKANNAVISLGTPLSTDKCFAKIVSSLKNANGNGRRNGGGALSSTCNAAGEIFQIAAIMNGLVLVGVAVGFVLLRVEAWLEESEAE